MNIDDLKKIWLTDNAVWIELKDGRQACELFADYALLANATIKQRENYTLSHFGVHWPDIDEDLSFDGFFSSL